MKGDLIRRQDAIDAIECRFAEPDYQHTGEDWFDGMSSAEFEIYKLPSAHPERENGEWFWDGWGYSCSGCDRPIYGNILEITRGDFKYCPFCGSEMLLLKPDFMRGNDDDI